MVEIVALVVCISRVVKVKGHLPVCREFSVLCTEEGAAVDHVV